MPTTDKQAGENTPTTLPDKSAARWSQMEAEDQADVLAYDRAKARIAADLRPRRSLNDLRKAIGR